MRTTQGDVSRKNSQGWGREWGQNSLLSLPLTLFPLIFFPLSNFAPHSTISKPGTGYIKDDHDFRDVVIASPWRITVLAGSLAVSPQLQVVYPYFRLRFRVICQRRSAVIGFSCCGVPTLIFKLLLVYCYVLITSVCISTVFFFFFFCILQGKANKIK